MIDPFCLFYNNLGDEAAEDNFWVKYYNSPKYNNWAGYAFEVVCLNHVPQIKKALGISGIMSNAFSWQNSNAQIDLVLDRADKVINVFEIKYSNAPYVVTKKYDLALRNKVGEFRRSTSTKKAIWPVFISPFGLAQSPYKYFFINECKMDVFFEKV